MIKIKFPDYYEKFSCIADKCEKTCCASWQVVVDDEARQRYEKETAKLGEKLREYMTFDGEDYIFRLENGRCPFLDDRNLCEIYSALGQKSLCRTCERYPRFETDFGGRKELGLSVSCPTAARLILLKDGFPTYKDSETDGIPEPNSIDPELYFSVMRARTHILKLLHEADELDEAFDKIVEFTAAFQKLTNSDCVFDETEKLISKKPKPVKREYGLNCLDELLSLEKLDSATHELALSKHGSKPDFHIHKNMLKRLFEYYIYRYFSLTVFGEAPLSAVRLAIFGVSCVASLLPENASENDVIDAAVAYSREVEHSQKNLDTVKNKYGFTLI